MPCAIEALDGERGAKPKAAPKAVKKDAIPVAGAAVREEAIACLRRRGSLGGGRNRGGASRVGLGPIVEHS